MAIPILSFTAFKWYEQHVQPLPYFDKGLSIEQQGKPLALSGFKFINQDNAPLDSGFVTAKVWVINTFFTSCPTICPKIMANMLLIRQAYRQDNGVKLLSLSIDPAHDTPARLKQYAALKGIKMAQWQLLTGNKKDVYHFVRNTIYSTAVAGDGGEGDFIHSDKIVLIDGRKHIRGYYDGTEAGEVQQLINDIKRLESEH
ncbi:SCO family protein [Mucilaginibacter psychrotolerans]|nr:SCO family protein [Mucilaginibacter psychrotolerans]